MKVLECRKSTRASCVIWFIVKNDDAPPTATDGSGKMLASAFVGIAAVTAAAPANPNNPRRENFTLLPSGSRPWQPELDAPVAAWLISPPARCGARNRWLIQRICGPDWSPEFPPRSIRAGGCEPRWDYSSDSNPTSNPSNGLHHSLIAKYTDHWLIGRFLGDRAVLIHMPRWSPPLPPSPIIIARPFTCGMSEID